MGPPRPSPDGTPWWQAWLPAGLWAVVIWTASSLVITPGMYPPVYAGDTIFHGGEFFVYGYLWQRGASLRRWPSGWHGWGLVMAVVVATALTDEWHQAFVPSRHPDLMDALADAGGGALGVLGFLVDRRLGH